MIKKSSVRFLADFPVTGFKEESNESESVYYFITSHEKNQSLRSSLTFGLLKLNVLESGLRSGPLETKEGHFESSSVFSKACIIILKAVPFD